MNYKILIIEDEIETSSFLSKALQDEGFDVECAPNGILGLELLKNEDFDMVILDLKMPYMTGDEVLEKIRDIAPYMEVVVYTNYTEVPIMKKLINLGVDGFIKKGADADLWDTVAFIKSKFEPISDENRKKILNKFFERLPNPLDNEVYS